MIVVDASVVVDILVRCPDAAVLERRVFTGTDDLCAPHLLDVEVTQVLRRFRRTGVLDDRRAREALADLADMPLQRFAHLPFLSAIWDLRDVLTAYDAAYVALAEALDAVLLTRDARLARTPFGTVHIERV